MSMCGEIENTKAEIETWEYRAKKLRENLLNLWAKECDFDSLSEVTLAVFDQTNVIDPIFCVTFEELRHIDKVLTNLRRRLENLER